MPNVPNNLGTPERVLGRGGNLSLMNSILTIKHIKKRPNGRNGFGIAALKSSYYSTDNS